MQKLLLKFKAFNNEHRKLALIFIFFELLLIIAVSIFKNIIKNFRLVLAVILVICIIFFSTKYLSGSKDEVVVENTYISTEQVEEQEEAASDIAGTLESIIDTIDEAVDEDSVAEVTDKESEDSAVEVIDKESEDSAVEVINKEEEKDSEDDLESSAKEFIADNPEAVGWLWFEDGLISYPIMQSGDNSKYALKDYEGNDSNTGSIFADYRSSTDFADSNTIIYGHNMRDRTMFGALKIYKEDLKFLEEHKYFRIITLNGTYRYLLFAFMDVPKDSYIYDVCGDNNERMREFLDTIEYKTYIDTGIEPTVEDKIITLSTCTKSDDLYFVMFAVQVE
ncbi:MAG: class B sortase [Butyrivibrio sp.]|nr:class B sortase [Butyrivibrio sp.]